MNITSKRAWLLAVLSAALIAAFLLYPQHRQHLFGLIPYWYLPAGFTGLRMTPPSHCRLLAG